MRKNAASVVGRLNSLLLQHLIPAPMIFQNYMIGTDAQAAAKSSELNERMLFRQDHRQPRGSSDVLRFSKLYSFYTFTRIVNMNPF